MDDARIEQIRREVMQQLDGSPVERATHDLESRVAALEAAVADLRQGHAPVLSAAPRGLAHPSLQVLAVSGGSDRCVMEPDKPCVQSHACRTFGH
jgi:primosomal protein N'